MQYFPVNFVKRYISKCWSLKFTFRDRDKSLLKIYVIILENICDFKENSVYLMSI